LARFPLFWFGFLVYFVWFGGFTRYFFSISREILGDCELARDLLPDLLPLAFCGGVVLVLPLPLPGVS